jgi:hypothetical protein
MREIGVFNMDLTGLAGHHTHTHTHTHTHLEGVRMRECGVFNGDLAGLAGHPLGLRVEVLRSQKSGS